MLDDPLALMSAHPGLVFVAVFVAAVLEYVFPPFWGDTFMLAGFFVAGTRHVSPAGVFAACVIGSCLGAVLAYGMGARFGRGCLRLLGKSRRAGRLAERMERLVERHGSHVIAFNRFLPGLRAFSIPLAGIGRMPFRRVLLWSTVSNLAYCTVLLGVGVAFGAAAPSFSTFVESFRTTLAIAALVAACLLASVLVATWAYRRRQAAGSGSA